ncbi:MAG: hypothetical protein A3G52_01845 [Candidatus Taylorbacteria bacterium RIFCSPLOWO2_12_FULL_43_20]|uniref:GrpB family protein n=1 Tax=Candidatus Taylorbacteria bacterium RIFCSPLOWO2_12_FULL_43_20 TaxID=1802332 RepID=A0A1G2P0Y5_9BACT|nr:MAG: hypothetical protein A3B98_00330 [Candidatus Taylorbacteria bacterium RIFCSPHIGHO2_02_FULL_43_55]OHA29943.1 MAG: hypothetical protein A3E92_03960 [Candidatus Taylorbacteria bacterium RIFCSPHIGHO2_12_FULL_42_34]OHA30575.1 MAG: hypothetical protein A3B09_01580 [Candidatus Taylorbacteria bacterium RIFCSPLOWO2_01_FULL_43_83]OHA38407.1 MAG: hypothetical protein A3H58_04385 [Candidatus Taylorbacteria bacterium RIFCSPLOWO2_02_FULL_43_22b]OHA42015.1 MAG: hypothetical protein A3G52_01845 [Candid
MNKTAKHPYKDRKYNIVAYDPDWPVQFEKFASTLRSIFGNVQVEHIGSTSVPGMSGKPCIDILVILDQLESIDIHIKDMEQAGFVYAGQFVMANSRLFRLMKDISHCKHPFLSSQPPAQRRNVEPQKLPPFKSRGSRKIFKHQKRTLQKISGRLRPIQNSQR